MANIYPPVGFFFRVEFQLGGVGSADAMFQEVNGFNAELLTEDVRQGGENRYIQTLPTRAKYSDLVLKRGLIVKLRHCKMVQGCHRKPGYKTHYRCGNIA